MSKIPKIGIVTVSDRASRGIYADESGPAILAFLTEALTTPFEPEIRVIADEQSLIEETLKGLVDEKDCRLVVTTGATEAVCDRMMPGFGELMRTVSLNSVPTAILSRQTAGLRKGSLIINLPGKPAAIRECLMAVFPAVPYCIDLMEGPRLETDPAVVVAFRPRSKPTP